MLAIDTYKTELITVICVKNITNLIVPWTSKEILPSYI